MKVFVVLRDFFHTQRCSYLIHIKLNFQIVPTRFIEHTYIGKFYKINFFIAHKIKWILIKLKIIKYTQYKTRKLANEISIYQYRNEEMNSTLSTEHSLRGVVCPSKNNYTRRSGFQNNTHKFALSSRYFMHSIRYRRFFFFSSMNHI